MVAAQARIRVPDVHGIHRGERLEAVTKAKRLRNWVALIGNLYGNRVLPFGSKKLTLLA